MGYYRRIRDMRTDHDLSQEQIAEILGMKRAQYQRYEAGTRDCPTEVIIRLADIYNTSTDYLLGRTKNPNPPKDE